MIDKCKQFNTKEADTLQTTECSKIPKIFWDIRIALLFAIFCKAEVFFNFVKPKFQKTLSFPKFQNSKKNINLPKNFWNFGILENSSFFFGILEHSKKTYGFFGIWSQNIKTPKVFLEFHSRFPKNTWFLKVFYQNFKTTLGFFEFSKIPKNLEFSKIPKFQKYLGKLIIFLEFWNFGKLEVFLEFDSKTSKNTRFFWNFIANSTKTQWFLRFSTKIPKKPRVFQNSKIPKIFGQVDNFFLEFWNFGKLEVFLEFDPKTSKNTRFFEFHSKFQKNTVVFKVFYQNSKKNLEFSKIPKISRRGLSPQIFLEFWNFGKLKVFFGIVRE